MSDEAFRNRRRQRFLTEKHFKINRVWIARLLGENSKLDESGLAPADPAYHGVFGSNFKEKLNLLRLHYTAGESIESLLPMYADTIACFDAWHVAYRTYIASIGQEQGQPLREDGTPLWFEDLASFQLAMDVVSLGVLLGQGDAVRQATAWLTRYRHTDMMFEAIVEPAFGKASTVEEFFHERPYDPLLDAIYAAESPENASRLVKAYLDGWYESFAGVPWHDGHTIVNDEYMAYEGYWAFEAAAVCVIHGIDDSTFRDHLVYPKDLADWARANGSVARVSPSLSGTADGSGAGRCEAGKPCPKAGFWFTPARVGSRRYFKANEVMPAVGGDYGATIWQWDQNQDPPKL